LKEKLKYKGLFFPPDPGARATIGGMIANNAGGIATGEHGAGIGKRKYMAAELGASLKWMQRLKSLVDTNGILNPGKISP
jgi:FAD/FMN-containing dehydrogenase